MAYTPKEIDRLLVFTAAELARKRRARGLALNHPEAVALITDEIFEEARAGRTYAEVVEHAQSVLWRSEVMGGVPEMIRTLHVDALFPDGTRLVVVHSPIQEDCAARDIPGQIIPAAAPVVINAGLPVTRIPITNTSTVPIHLTAHFHVFEANPRLAFDRLKAWGMRLDVSVDGSTRIEPGATVEIALVAIGGARVIHGFQGTVNGPLVDADMHTALVRLMERGFMHVPTGISEE